MEFKNEQNAEDSVILYVAPLRETFILLARHTVRLCSQATLFDATGDTITFMTTRPKPSMPRRLRRTADLTGRRLGRAVLGYLIAMVAIITLSPFRFALTPQHGFTMAGHDCPAASRCQCQ